ncbi:MAG: DUF2974 domain-containing protein [Crocinitomix sp.]|nr:DUF2974 domain-containing protein [Crocinitomix sp.]
MKKISQIILIPFFLVLGFSCSNNNNDNNKSEAFISERENYSTQLIPNSFVSDGETPIPPDSLFKIVKYESEVGLLDAYLSTNIDTTKKYPVVVWAHGGFGGIGSWFWEDQSYISSFIHSDVVIFCPSWRGENNNPGSFELFYGEVNDLTNAIEYVSSLAYTDSSRIYLAGHSTGGTLCMLASMMSDKIRATFSFGGAPDIQAVVGDGEGYGNTPYDYKVNKESELRSAINFVQDFKNPVYYFEGEDSFYSSYALKMEKQAVKMKIPFQTFIVPNGTHFNIVSPINELIVEKIRLDDQPELNINFTLEEINNKMQ